MSDDECKLFLHHRYEFVESGPARVEGSEGDARRLRLLFIPFSFANPTYGDVVLAKRDPEYDDHWTFEVPESGGMAVEDLEEHGGRYAMIVDFQVPDGDGGPWFGDREDILSSRAWACEPDKPGRVYFAAPEALSPKEVMTLLRAEHPRATFELIHPSEP